LETGKWWKAKHDPYQTSGVNEMVRSHKCIMGQAKHRHQTVASHHFIYSTGLVGMFCFSHCSFLYFLVSRYSSSYYIYIALGWSERHACCLASPTTSFISTSGSVSLLSNVGRQCWSALELCVIMYWV
jgi:hypothetical protein